MTISFLPGARAARAVRDRLLSGAVVPGTSGSLPRQRTPGRDGRPPQPTGHAVATRRPDSPRTDRSGLAILIVTSEAPPVISGISKTVAMLERGLTDQGHEVDIISREDFPRFIRGEMRFSAFAFYWRSMRRRLPDYDVVNLHGPVPTISEVFLLLTKTMRLHRRPAIVYTHHSDLSISSLERLCSVYNELANRVAHSADAIVVSSKAYDEKIEPADRQTGVGDPVGDRVGQQPQGGQGQGRVQPATGVVRRPAAQLQGPARAARRRLRPAGGGGHHRRIRAAARGAAGQAGRPGAEQRDPRRPAAR